MKLSNIALVVGLQFAVLAGLSFLAHAFDLTGAWTTDRSICSRLFSKTGNAVAFKPNSDMEGRGFIVEENNIRGQFVTCAIRSRTEKGTELHLIASCATDIMIDRVQMSFRITGNDTVTRIFPNVDGLEAPYVRCSFN
jgi:hypothetical protein